MDATQNAQSGTLDMNLPSANFNMNRLYPLKRKNPVGRPPVHCEIKQIILSMKNDNLYWGYKKIQGELLKLGISLDQKTIRNILGEFR